MLRLWRDRVCIALCPDKVVLARFGMGRRVSAKETVACPDAADDAGWEPALATLKAALADKKWAGGGATVILSNHFVRYLLVPSDDKLVSADERRAMVHHSFTQAYGEAVENWELRWDEGRPPAAYLASAVDRPLLDGLRASFKASAVQLDSVQPYLMAAFNCWRRELGDESAWFLLAERGRLCLAWFARGEWGALQSQRIGGEWAEELPGILERTALLGGIGGSAGTVFLHAPEEPDVRLALGSEWALRALRLRARPGFSPIADARYAMAMAG